MDDFKGVLYIGTKDFIASIICNMKEIESDVWNVVNWKIFCVWNGIGYGCIKCNWICI